MSEIAFLNDLNPQQLDAVHTLDGPLLILAGAGSGKTRVLTYRFANLILQGMTAPENILAVTFTNKAAKEMQYRVSKILDSMNVIMEDSLWISTFHSMCARILRKDIDRIGYKKSFSIYDPADQLSQVKKVLKALNINEKIYPAKSFRSRISSAKMMGLLPEDIPQQKFHVMDKRSLEVYSSYEREMKAANALDFDDLLLKTIFLFEHASDILQNYQNLFQYIMIDEYQDTNPTQYRLIQLLAKTHQNLCVVGDEDQSIYSWRGADIQNILSFEKDFLGAKTIKLEQNYRSTRTIVEAASHVIAKNTQRKNKVLFTENDEGDAIVVREELDEYGEAKFVAQSIQGILQTTEAKASDIAVFYRTNAQSRVLEEQMRSFNIPYKIVGGLKFYDRMEIKDMLCYLRLIVNPTDDAAFRRILNVPARGIGKSTLEKIETCAIEKQISLLSAAEIAIQEKRVHTGAQKKIRNFLELITELTDSASHLRPTECYHMVLDKTQYVEKLKLEDTPEAQARIENLEEFDNALVKFEEERGDEANLVQFLEEMSLISDADQIPIDEDCVSMMTLHISKGLEYPYVFIVGVEEGIFPGSQAIESADLTDMEEERRLAYVGFTRAEKQLVLVHVQRRRIWGTTHFHEASRFIHEIPDDYILKSSAVYARPKSSLQKAYKSYQEQEFEDFSQEPESGMSLREGYRVRHPAFGVGTVHEINGSGEDARISILFQDDRLKTFVAKYARLERI